MKSKAFSANQERINIHTLTFCIERTLVQAEPEINVPNAWKLPKSNKKTWDPCRLDGFGCICPIVDCILIIESSWIIYLLFWYKSNGECGGANQQRPPTKHESLHQATWHATFLCSKCSRGNMQAMARIGHLQNSTFGRITIKRWQCQSLTKITQRKLKKMKTRFSLMDAVELQAFVFWYIFDG